MFVGGLAIEKLVGLIGVDKYGFGLGSGLLRLFESEDSGSICVLFRVVLVGLSVGFLAGCSAFYIFEMGFSIVLSFVIVL